MSLTVTTRAARNDIAPVMVKTEMNQLSSDGSKPFVVFAEVSSGYSPVIGANITATLQSDTGFSHTLYLLDNGAGTTLDFCLHAFFTFYLNDQNVKGYRHFFILNELEIDMIC